MIADIYRKNAEDFTRFGLQMEMAKAANKQQIEHTNADFNDRMNYFKQQQLKLSSDIQLGIKSIRSELGLNNKDMPSRVSLYTLNKVMDMVLQYLMINQIYH